MVERKPPYYSRKGKRKPDLKLVGAELTEAPVVLSGLAKQFTEAPEVTPELAAVSEALAAFSTDAAKLGRDLWSQIGRAVCAATDGSDEGFQLFDEWSRPWLYYDADETRRCWDSWKASPPADMNSGTLVEMAGKVREQEQGLDEATRLDDVAFQTQKSVLKKKTGLGVGALEAERKRRRKRGVLSTPPPPPPRIEDLAEAAKDIIASDDVLGLFVKHISARLAGADGGNAELLYLCATSRLFDKPMNVVHKGESAAGKSYERDCVLAYMPPEDLVTMTTMTEKALIYLPNDLSHKILSMAEAVGADESKYQEYLIRELISEGRLRHWIAVPGGPGELPTTLQVVKEGPIMFVTTTTRARLHPELETRILTLEANDTAGHTRRVLEKVAEVAGLGGSVVDLAPWHDFQRWLAAGERRVTIPFALTLARHPNLYVKGVRMRRDFRQVLNAIQAHALLHREHRKRDGKGRIIATIKDDYVVAFDLLTDRLAQGAGVMLRSNEMKMFEAIQELQKDLRKDEGVTVQILMDDLRLSQPTVNRRLSKLVVNGFVENLNPGKGKTGRYRTVVAAPSAITVLPHPDDLLEAQKKKSS